MISKINKSFVLLCLLAMISFLSITDLSAQFVPRITIGIDEATAPAEVANSLQILFLLTVLSIAPSILILMTSFTRITIVLSFVRKALGTNNEPSNQIMVSLALFLTFFIMSPIFKNINDTALQPYMQGHLTHGEFYEKGIQPLRDFMLKQTRQKDLALMLNASRSPRPNTADDIPIQIV
ncbi:MAG: flagellar biosynthetic protein FliP, partial [Candidatus Cloacimonetes bacterium]|nr:flagellar biosynthetic protein FliP [Candidatus Cloacimonadota bacterium]